MADIKNIRFKRTIIPEDAVDTNINTIDFGDASGSIACAAIYARLLRKNGKYSCQLVFSRSKLLSDLSQPRAELQAVLLNARTGEVVKRAFQHRHQKFVKLTDSQIVLHWISNNDKVLKQWVRNRVIEIQRLTKIEDWKYINTSHMLADIGTRRGATIKDVDQESKWVNGEEWMKDEEEEFPIKTVSQIILSSSDLHEASKEAPSLTPSVLEEEVCNVNVMSDSHISCVSDEVQKRYSYSNYVIDPNKFRYQKVIRILAIVQKFINLIKCSVIRRMQNVHTKNDQGKQKK